MEFGQAITSGFANYVNFKGRACRSEFWYWTLFAVLASLAANIIDGFLLLTSGAALLSTLVGLGLLLPGLAVGVRRLHDIDRTGWWVLIAFTLIGLIVLIYWDCLKGTDGPNQYGPDPLAS
jgi:uncharacterized membrane protein YhaH (DUF805 family)